MARAKQTKQIRQLTIKQFEEMFPDEDACDAYLVAHRWPEQVYCPRCGSARVYELKTRPFHWECPDCRVGGAYRFSNITGTVFENTNVNLREWFRVIHLMLTAKKGISSRQVWRYMGFGSLKTAWYMCHRIRAGLQNEEFRKLMGIVEVDETYVGGKESNRHDPHDRSNGGGPSGGAKPKTPVVAAVQRKGNVVARVLDRVNQRTINHFVGETIADRVSLIATDESSVYAGLPNGYEHGTVNHRAGKYVIGAIHTNTIGVFFADQARDHRQLPSGEPEVPPALYRGIPVPI